MVATITARWRRGSFKVQFVVLILSLIELVVSQISPCPRLFSYEPRNPSEPDKWYGQVILISDSKLSGVWLRIVFDKDSIQLGNWFGEVLRRENYSYLIQNPSFILQPHTPHTVRFYIRYNVGESPPKLVEFRLNAKTVCPEASTTPSPQSFELLSTSPSLEYKSNVYGSRFIAKPTVNYDEDDYFNGDFYFLKKKPDYNSFLEPTCGTVIKQPSPLIVHGQSTNEAEFPWHAALYHSRGIDLTYICGGSLITRQHLLTVAHCVNRKRTRATLDPESLVAYLGKYYLKRWSNVGIQERQVERIMSHPKYNPRGFTNDLAVLKLMSPVDVTDYVRPVCLWEGKADLDPIVGQLGVVVGWGYDETGKVTEALTKASMPIVSQEKCIYSFPEFFSRFTSSNTFCAGFRNGTSVCNGDSGGGMVLPKFGTNPIWQIRGLVSISVALQNQFKCDASHYVVFTDVAKYVDWIKGVVRLG